MPVEVVQEDAIPEGWLSRDVQIESSLVYTRQRDIHDVGIVLLKMLLGLDVVDRFMDPITAIHSCECLSAWWFKTGSSLSAFPASVSPFLARHAIVMIQATKKSTVMNLLSDFTDGVHGSPVATGRIPASLTGMCFVSVSSLKFISSRFEDTHTIPIWITGRA
jgi:translation initiation factor 2-alpha kinase 4